MNFSGFNGSENLKNSLNALENGGRLPHAIIISGSTAEEREALTRLLSKWEVCSSDGERPCGVCKNCVNAEEKAHSDIYYAVGSGKTEIYSAEELKRIVADASIKPNQADRKVYIFEDCDRRLPAISQNILLKTLEEPPQDILFILTCKNSKLLLETIRSRATTLQLKDDLSVSSDALKIAEEMMSGIVSPSEINLLRATFKLNERFLALSALDAAALLLRDGMALYMGGTPELSSEAAEKLCRKLTKAHFLELIEVTGEAREKINQNIPLKLVSTWLCAQYRRTVWQK